MTKNISGFSKFSKVEKIDWLSKNFFQNPSDTVKIIKQYWNENESLQNLHDDFIENTITNFYMPFGIAPNFLINGKEYVVPMVTEESSVVAAASLVAKFWSTKGGFKTTVLGTTKIGQVHFMFAGKKADIESYFQENKTELFTELPPSLKIWKNVEEGF